MNKVINKSGGIISKIINSFKTENIKNNLLDSTKNKVRARQIQVFILVVIRSVLLIGLCFIIVYPIIQQISLALRHPMDLTNPIIIWIPEHFTWLNIKISAIVLEYKDALWNTFRISFIVTICQVLAASITGYAFAKLHFPGKNILFGLVILTIVVPPQTISLPTYLYLVKSGLYGKAYALPLMALLGMGIKSGLFIYIFRQFFRGIPAELEESAQIDGAGVFRTFWNIMLPNARGAMVTVGLFAFVWQWNDIYFTGLFFGTRDDFPMLTLKLANLADNMKVSLGYANITDYINPEIWLNGDNVMYNALIANTSAFLMMVPLIIMYLFVQKSFVEGIERTGIVG